MRIETKKYQLESKLFITMAMKNVMKDLWWAWLVPVAMIVLGVILEGGLYWFFWIAILLSVLYIIFWIVQFAGMTQLEQTKFLFEKLNYEIDSRQFIIKLNKREGMPINWDTIKQVKKTKKGYQFYLSRFQFIYLPFSIFKTENEIRFLETILKRKNYLE